MGEVVKRQADTVHEDGPHRTKLTSIDQYSIKDELRRAVNLQTISQSIINLGDVNGSS